MRARKERVQSASKQVQVRTRMHRVSERESMSSKCKRKCSEHVRISAKYQLA